MSMCVVAQPPYLQVHMAGQLAALGTLNGHAVALQWTEALKPARFVA